MADFALLKKHKTTLSTFVATLIISGIFNNHPHYFNACRNTNMGKSCDYGWHFGTDPALPI